MATPAPLQLEAGAVVFHVTAVGAESVKREMDKVSGSLKKAQKETGFWDKSLGATVGRITKLLTLAVGVYETFKSGFEILFDTVGAFGDIIVGGIVAGTDEAKIASEEMFSAMERQFNAMNLAERLQVPVELFKELVTGFQKGTVSMGQMIERLTGVGVKPEEARNLADSIQDAFDKEPLFVKFDYDQTFVEAQKTFAGVVTALKDGKLNEIPTILGLEPGDLQDWSKRFFEFAKAIPGFRPFGDKLQRVIDSFLERPSLENFEAVRVAMNSVAPGYGFTVEGNKWFKDVYIRMISKGAMTPQEVAAAGPAKGISEVTRIGPMLIGAGPGMATKGSIFGKMMEAAKKEGDQGGDIYTSEGLHYLHEGERVVPRGGSMGGGGNFSPIINLTLDIKMGETGDVDELVEKVREALMRTQYDVYRSVLRG